MTLKEYLSVTIWPNVEEIFLAVYHEYEDFTERVEFHTHITDHILTSGKLMKRYQHAKVLSVHVEADHVRIAVVIDRIVIKKRGFGRECYFNTKKERN